MGFSSLIELGIILAFPIGLVVLVVIMTRKTPAAAPPSPKKVPTMRACPTCGTPNADTQQSCWTCGTKL